VVAIRTDKHVAVSVVSDGEQMRGHLSSSFALISVDDVWCVDRQTTVRVDDHTEQSRVCLQHSNIATLPGVGVSLLGLRLSSDRIMEQELRGKAPNMRWGEIDCVPLSRIFFIFQLKNNVIWCILGGIFNSSADGTAPYERTRSVVG